MDTSRIKVILAEQTQTNNKCLAEQLAAATAAVSKWSANTSQPRPEALLQTIGLVK